MNKKLNTKKKPHPLCKGEIIRLKREITKLKKLVIRDPLTGTLNRRGIESEIGVFFREVNYLKKNPKAKRSIGIRDMSLIFADLDDFKEVNNTYGHHTGDVVLRWVVSELTRKIREIDIVGRIGGDEFIIALMGTGEDQAFKKAEEIRNWIKSRVIVEKYKKLRVTMSMGVVSVKRANAENLTDLINLADKAMYRAKIKLGKDKTVKHSEIMLS